MKHIVVLIDNRWYLETKEHNLLGLEGNSVENMMTSLCKKQTIRNPNFILDVFVLSLDERFLPNQIERMPFEFSTSHDATEELTKYLESHPGNNRASYIYSSGENPYAPQILPIFTDVLCKTLGSEMAGEEETPYIVVLHHNRERLDVADLRKPSYVQKSPCVHMELSRYYYKGPLDSTALQKASIGLSATQPLEGLIDLLNEPLNPPVEFGAAAGRDVGGDAVDIFDIAP